MKELVDSLLLLPEWALIAAGIVFVLPVIFLVVMIVTAYVQNRHIRVFNIEIGVAKKSLADDASEATANWQRVSNIFWLGHDIGRAIEKLDNKGSTEATINALQRIAEHGKKLEMVQAKFLIPDLKGFERTVISMATESIFDRAARLASELVKINSGEGDVMAEFKTSYTREKIMEELVEMRSVIGNIVEEKQKTTVSITNS